MLVLNEQERLGEVLLLPQVLFRELLRVVCRKDLLLLPDADLRRACLELRPLLLLDFLGGASASPSSPSSAATAHGARGGKETCSGCRDLF